MINNARNSIPQSLSELLVKLNILSMIECGKKINLSTMSFVDSTSWWGSLSRTIYGESRKNMIVHLYQIINQSIEAIEEYKNTELQPILIEHLTKAKIGIQNLATTYHHDPNIVAQINVCISNIELQLRANN